jgi:hypothetical protein
VVSEAGELNAKRLCCATRPPPEPTKRQTTPLVAHSATSSWTRKSDRATTFIAGRPQRAGDWEGVRPLPHGAYYRESVVSKRQLRRPGG